MNAKFVKTVAFAFDLDEKLNIAFYEMICETNLMQQL